MEFSGRNAVVTGAANGIGLGLCRALARRGVNIVLTDIERESLQRAARELSGFNVKTRAIELDVSDRKAMESAVAEVEETFGPVHFLFNNAGVALGAKPLWEVAASEWDWILGVNLHGVLNGIGACVPRMLRHGEGGYVVNTASIGGLQVNPALRNSSYVTTKYAIVAMSEALALDLEGKGVGVSVLCPGLVNTTLDASARRRPARFGGPFERTEKKERTDISADAAWHTRRLAPDVVGERVLHAVERGEFFIFTHEEPRQWIEQRHKRLLEGFDRIAAYNAQSG